MNPAYPDAERLDLVEDLHGHAVADPYRWLEDADDPRTRTWSAAQDELTATRTGALPGRDRLAETLHGLLRAGSVGAPIWRAGRTFRMQRSPGQEHAVLLVSDEGGERVLLDPTVIDPSGLTTLDTWVPDLEGRRLAYQLSSGGDEHSTLHVLDVETGQAVEEPIDRCRYSDVSWVPGGDEYLYVRMIAEDEVPEGSQQAFHRRVWRHRVGTDPATDTLVEGPGMYSDHNYYGVSVDRDGRWLIVSATVGTARRDSVWIGELAAPGEPQAPLTPILTQADDVRASLWVRHGRLYVLTADDAPRWRLMITEPERPQREHWRELIAEDPGSVLEGVRHLRTPDGDPLLVVLRSRHAVSELALHAFDGALLREIPLPGKGTVTGLTVADRDTPDQHGSLWFGWTDPVTPTSIHRFDVSTGDVEVERIPPGHVDVPAARSEQRGFTSADGTTVRMFVLSPAGGSGPRPTLVTGYGGFGISREPTYTSFALAWVAAGGTYVLVSLRGGGEEGEAWHRAGKRESKQNVFDDLHAAAEALVDAGDTTPGQLAIMGGSNGGLLVGAALVQRPDLYRAVVCSAPLLDMVRYEHFSLGRTWNEEYGTADDPTELGWLLSYSPYHHVVEDVTYPSVLFTVFDSDTRVDPLHARKMCAALQHATTGDPDTRPILIRRETDVGHGARSVSRTVGLAADQLAFLAHYTGLELPG